jgi:hypothetical protein
MERLEVEDYGENEQKIARWFFDKATTERLDELKAKAREEKKDFICLVVVEALELQVPNAHLLIKNEERNLTKHLLFGYLYGLTGKKMVDYFKKIGTQTGRL